MKTTESLIAQAEALIKKSQNLRDATNNDLHGKVAALIQESDEKYYEREEKTKKIRSDPRYAAAAARVSDMEDRVWNEAKQQTMSDKEREARKRGNTGKH
jgi:hypothetical protein